MKFAITLLACSMFVTYSGISQVPTPRSSTISGPSWTKTAESSYTLRDASGSVMSNTQKLNYLKTDTLSYLDKNTRTLYLLPDCKNAAIGASGKIVVLASNLSKNFYITNTKSFITYINDKSYSGDFVNINGSYLYYLKELDKSYYHDGIRSYSNWGARNVRTMEYAPDHTYWYRDVEKKRYGVVKKGESIDYDRADTEADGNDLVVKIDGVKTYRLRGYYTMSSFTIKPVELITQNTSSTVSSTSSSGSDGCVRGDCVNGWGKWQYDSGYYEGFWTNGLKHGYGLYKWDGLGKYIGNWKNDNMHGYGAYLADNDDNIVGWYENGKLNGVGYSVFGDTWSQGIYSDGSLVTAHSYYRNDVDMGCTSGDCQNKYGYFKWDNGDHFVGFFKNGNLYLGTYTFADGNKYSGMFNSSNQYHGTGRFFFKDGSYYGGEWQYGKYSGRGYYHDSATVQKIGVWSNGSLTNKFN